jgi:hypothetical protein
MFCVRLGVGVTLGLALATACAAQERPPMEFTPDEVSRPDAGTVSQEEDREAAPLTPTAPKPAPVAKPAAPPPPPRVAAPKPDKPKQQHAAKHDQAPPPVDEPRPPKVPPKVTLHVWEPEKATRFYHEETIE